MNKIKYPLSAFDLSTLPRLADWVKNAIVKYPTLPYGMTATDLMYAYEFGKSDTSYDWSKVAKTAVLMVDKYVSDAEAQIALGKAPAIAGDQYLQVGPQVRDVCLVLDWAEEFVSESQKARWLKFIWQTGFNLQNPSRAVWGGKTFVWPGWAKDDPANNYFFSHALAFACESLISGSISDYLNSRFALLQDFWSKYEGGGSPEGTGYGIALARLFEVCLMWRESTGQDIPAVTKHAEATIKYIIHSTVPKFDEIAPLGDQARISRHMIDDPDRFLMLWARALAVDEDAKAMAAWWLDELPFTKMKQAYNCRHDLLDHGRMKRAPTELVYHAKGAGHLFARNAWTRDASYIVVAAGPNNQSHDQDDQGAVSFYSNGVWLAVTQNIWTRTGIEGAPEYQNAPRFITLDGKTVRQSTKTTCTMEWRNEGNTLVIDLDIAPAYDPALVPKYRRSLAFRKGYLAIVDDFEIGVGIKIPIFQFNTPDKPVIDGQQITAGSLSVYLPGEDDPVMQVIDYKAMSAADHPGGGFRTEIAMRNNYFYAQLSDNTILQSPDVDPPEEDETVEALLARVAALEAEIDLLNDQAVNMQTITNQQAEKLTLQNVEISALKATAAQSQEVIAGLREDILSAAEAMKGKLELIESQENLLISLNAQVANYKIESEALANIKDALITRRRADKILADYSW